MIQALLTYKKSACMLCDFGGNARATLKPGDLVFHLMQRESFGLLVSKISDEHMIVLWTKAPGAYRQAQDRFMDQKLADNPDYGTVTITEP